MNSVCRYAVDPLNGGAGSARHCGVRHHGEVRVLPPPRHHLFMVFTSFSFIFYVRSIDDFFALKGLLHRGTGRQVKSRLCSITTGNRW
jgi:hypothetical protein